MAAAAGTATLAALTWSVTAGTAVAGAATRVRSGTLHAQLVSHVSTAANPVSTGLPLKGSNVIAEIVGVMAVLAVAFLVVTFIRRRITSA
jgi:hypothetical protein